MAFCPHCGNQVEENVKFCTNCGKAIYEKTSTGNVRRQVYQGEIRKCPSCGAEVPSFTATCPECGHEFNSGRVTSTIQDFSEKLHEYDVQIANAPTEKSGWSSWSTAGKVGWVILNIYTICIPLLIYSIKPKKYKAGSYTQQKASFIETYLFPNEREAIIEALLFVKAQLTNIVNGAIDGANIFWEKVWSNKAAQLHQKAEIVMPTDAVAGQTYNDITALEQQFKKKVLIRRIIIVVIVIAAVILFWALGSRGERV